MIPWKKALASTVGRKFIMSLSGIALVLFIIIHLAGNLTLLEPTGTAFNAYANKYAELGLLLYPLEIGLLIVIVIHSVVGFMLWRKSAGARESRYAVFETKGGQSRYNISSNHMLLLGVVLLVFMIVHVLHFRFEAFAGEHFLTDYHEKEIRDIHRLVVQDFNNPWWLLFYLGTMFFLGFHIRHGVWSMFQSIGAMPTPWSNIVYVIGTVLAVLLAVGFLILPLYIFIRF